MCSHLIIITRVPFFLVRFIEFFYFGLCPGNCKLVSRRDFSKYQSVCCATICYVSTFKAHLVVNVIMTDRIKELDKSRRGYDL